MYHRSFLIATLALDVGIEKKGKTMMQKKNKERDRGCDIIKKKSKVY
jgi:hypothetical protein